MKPGDSVIFLDDPLLYGTGEVERVLPNGRIVVRFDEGGQDENFDAHELELLDRWASGESLPTGSVFETVPQPDRGYGRPSCS